MGFPSIGKKNSTKTHDMGLEPATSPESPQVDAPTDDQAFSDKFEKKVINSPVFERTVKPLKKIEAQRQEQIKSSKVTLCFLDERPEQAFINAPNYDDFLKIVHTFDNTYKNNAQAQYYRLDSILIAPSTKAISRSLDALDVGVDMDKLDQWTQKNRQQYNKEEQSTKERAWTRDQKILRKGPGFSGHMTPIVRKTKLASYYTKSNLCIRGNMFKLNNQICGKSLEEMLPRYGSRRGKHIGIRVTQFSLMALLEIAGLATSPVTFGASIIVSQQLQIIVTLTGEVIGLKWDGAQKRKMASHAAIRAIELELLRVPVIGSFVYYAEYGVFGVAAAGIVSTTIAEWILESMSDRFTSTISPDDMGDPSVLFEMNQRIDYLSRFLLPYGQYLLLNEQDPEKQKKLRKVLKEHFNTLRHLEHQNIKALNFYRLALLAGRSPPSMREEVEQACNIARGEIRMNTHRTVRQCLGALLKDENGGMV